MMDKKKEYCCNFFFSSPKLKTRPPREEPLKKSLHGKKDAVLAYFRSATCKRVRATDTEH